MASASRAEQPERGNHMTKSELLERLIVIHFQSRWPGREAGDIEILHKTADDTLLAFLDDPEITEVYNSIPRWSDV